MKNHIKYLVLALLLLGCKNYKSLTTQIDKNKARYLTISIHKNFKRGKLRKI
ncbi:hypothetical protein [Capnocytophaga sputigena]|uniref:hypothetical protein n=1 Tax=Capnocytophaga sputigena TaxID=1019 RepID=UPI0028EFB4EE|nr:hypothetical protein [Capnocytophaga sputigena]